MTGSELLFYVGLFIFGGLVMAWILIIERRKQIKAETGGTKDHLSSHNVREQTFPI